MIKVITVCSHTEHVQPLIKSLEKHGWDYELIHCEWKGFGTKLIETYNYLKSHPEVDEFIFVDAFDAIAMGSQDEFKNKIGDVPMLTSAEKGLWPPVLIPFKKLYHQWEHGFNYPNSGLYYAKSLYFIWLFETYPPFYEIDDQYWLNMCFNLEHNLHTDYDQEVFNSHSFISEGEYTYNNGRIQILGNEPIFIHSNGKTVDEKLIELLK